MYATLVLLVMAAAVPASGLSDIATRPMRLTVDTQRTLSPLAFSHTSPTATSFRRLRGGAPAKQADKNEGPSTADVRFQWPDQEGLQSVEVSGSWDNWAKVVPLEIKGKVYERVLQLPQGAHTYKFILNGSNWVCSDAVPQKADPDGNKNNIVSITNSDCVHHRMKGAKPAHSGNIKDSFMALLMGVVKIGSAAAAVFLGVYLYQNEIKPRWLD
mmetsp:Transcript_26790/g.52263  ORF Transcript_26790/g.52263 Transcript_26790/m.52263 type:complete len:214 (-) Transcript_26790:488-1129(-)